MKTTVQSCLDKTQAMTKMLTELLAQVADLQADLVNIKNDSEAATTPRKFVVEIDTTDYRIDFEVVAKDRDDALWQGRRRAMAAKLNVLRIDAKEAA